MAFMSGVRTAVLMTPRPEGLSSAVEVDAELVVPIANNETRSLAERRAVAELLRCLLLGGSPRYGHVHDFARAEIQGRKQACEFRKPRAILRRTRK